MAKKKKTTTRAREKRDLTKFCAFWALTISAFMYIFGGLINLIIKGVKDLGGTRTADVLLSLSGIAVFLGNIALIIAIAIPAYGYIRGKKKGWKVTYWVALAVFVLGVVFGLICNWI